MSKQSSDPSSKSSGKPLKRYSPQTISLAHYGTGIRRLLWQKIIATAMPEQRGLLLAYANLLFTELQIIPYESTCVVSHDYLLEKIQTVEQLLTGFTNDMLH